MTSARVCVWSDMMTERLLSDGNVTIAEEIETVNKMPHCLTRADMQYTGSETSTCRRQSRTSNDKY